MSSLPPNGGFILVQLLVSLMSRFTSTETVASTTGAIASDEAITLAASGLIAAVLVPGVVAAAPATAPVALLAGCAAGIACSTARNCIK